MTDGRISTTTEQVGGVGYHVFSDRVRLERCWTAPAHLQTFKAHVKLASMEGVCECIVQFSSS